MGNRNHGWRKASPMLLIGVNGDRKASIWLPHFMAVEPVLVRHKFCRVECKVEEGQPASNYRHWRFRGPRGPANRLIVPRTKRTSYNQSQGK
jgi:hypothetical protein